MVDVLTALYNVSLIEHDMNLYNLPPLSINPSFNSVLVNFWIGCLTWLRKICSTFKRKTPNIMTNT